MRPSLLFWTLVATISSATAAPPGNDRTGAGLAREAISGETPAKGGEAVDYTIFNGIKVPPMKDIQGDEFQKTIKDGYW